MEEQNKEVNKELQVVFEDNHLLICLKPHNLLSQSDKTGDASIVDIAKNYLKTTYNKPGNVYVGLVHRLDRPTGGLIALTKTSKAAERLTSEMQTEEFKKEYLAVVLGKFESDDSKGTLKHYLEKDEDLNKVKVYNYAKFGAKLAELDYEVIDEKEINFANGRQFISLVKVRLKTGRSHQIRVQFKQIGHSVFADTKYGEVAGENLALWAYRLSLIHPTTKEDMVFMSYPNKEASPWKFFDIDRFLRYNINMDNN